MLNLALVTTAVGLGVAYAAAPGAVNTEAIRRGISHGARSTLFVETGSLIGDSLWAVLALAGVTVFARHLAVQVVLGIAGGCFLLRMAWLALHEAIVARPTTATSPGISAAIRWGRRWVRPSFFRWINALCGLALGYFGIRVLWTTVQAWIEQQVTSSLKSAH